MLRCQAVQVLSTTPRRNLVSRGSWKLAMKRAATTTTQKTALTTMKGSTTTTYDRSKNSTTTTTPITNNQTYNSSNKPKNTTTKPTLNVLIVGTGLTGAICSHLIRRACTSSIPSANVRIEVADMARGAGGRMTTTRQKMHNLNHWETKVNTGAQYVSCFSDETVRSLRDVCAGVDGQNQLPLHETKDPEGRTLHFQLAEERDYFHFAIPEGTNSLVKQFLYAGRPDVVSFETRVKKLWKETKHHHPRITPEFDLRRNSNNRLSGAYDVVVLALPPKDIAKFFESTTQHRHDPQSQADLHRNFNQKNQHFATRNGLYASLALDALTNAKLRGVRYVGRYSLVLWFDRDNGKDFAKTVYENWRATTTTSGGRNDKVIDAIFLQCNGHVLVVQSTVELWRKFTGVGEGRRGGSGRSSVRNILIQAMEELADGNNSGSGGKKTTATPMPKEAHAKLLNWRTSQVDIPLKSSHEETEAVVTTEDGRVVLTGDWCVESSLEGCFRAATAASGAVVSALEAVHVTKTTSSGFPI